MKTEDLKQISKWDWPNTISVPDGYDMTSIPDATRDNLIFLAKKYNELVQAITGQEDIES